MIKNYGLHWTVERVYWGGPGPGKQGSLLGAKTRSRNAVSVDFRGQRGIYALYADYDLVYVGQTGAGNHRLFHRLKEHRNDYLSERWNRFSWFGIRWVTQNNQLSADALRVGPTVPVTLNILEAVSIAIAEPRLNLQRGRWGEAEKYFQYWDRTEDELEEDE